jgi:hypothetical protein
MSEPHVTWTSGGQAWIVSLSGAAIELRSTVPWPPGSRVERTLRGHGGTVRLKVDACRRMPGEAFWIEGRPLDLTRRVRASLEALLSP